MPAVVITYMGRTYGVEQIAPGVIQVFTPVHSTLAKDEENARQWLGDHSLKSSKAKKLLAAALRNEGELSDPKHPMRVRL